jgi:dihydroflavonol-4-reductase
MRVLVVGGSGLLGSATAELAKARGHDVTVLARNPPADGSPFLNIDVYGLAKDAWPAVLTGFDTVVYAMGKDDREAQPRPAYTAFAADHVVTCGAMATAAREVGVRRFVCFGSGLRALRARIHQYIQIVGGTPTI